jgi:hypothetical protein
MSRLVPGRVAGFSKFGEQAAEAFGNALVAVDFAVPAALPCVVGEPPFDTEAVAQPWRVLGVVTNLAQVACGG